jgi:hypothetical protein
MKVTVKWTNRNAAAEGHRIYKSTAPIDPDNLPAVLTTVGPAVTEYVDTDVVRGTRYYYRVGTFQGTDFALSTEMEVEAVPYTGPGVAEPVYGDYENGFFGILEAYELVSGPELKSLINHTLSAGDPAQRWVKVAHKGKILFVPMDVSFGRHTWQQIYQNGLIYGVDGNGPAEAVTANGEVGVNQLKTFSKFGSTFKVRSLKGLPDTGVFGWDGNRAERPAGLELSEYNQVMTRIAYGLYGEGMGISIDGLTPITMSTTSYGDAASICQELLNGNAIQRSLRWNNLDVMGAAHSIPVSSGSTGTGLPGTTYARWKPVLELIDN